MKINRQFPKTASYIKFQMLDPRSYEKIDTKINTCLFMTD